MSDINTTISTMQSIITALPFLWTGFLVTLKVSVLVVFFSLILGTFLGTLTTYGPHGLRPFILAFSDVIRGIPVLILIFFVFYGLPMLGINLNNFVSAVIALTLFSSAQIIEISRGALESIHHGQMEASKAVGLTFGQRMRYVIFPQATRRFLPPWINSVTDAVKGSALVSLVGVVDLMLSTQQVIARTNDAMPMYLLAAFLYFMINYTLSTLSRVLESRFEHIRE